WKEAKWLNKTLGQKLGYGKIYVPENQMPKGHAFIEVKSETLEFQKRGELCAEPMIFRHTPPPLEPLRMGQFMFAVNKVTNYLEGGMIVICHKKLKSLKNIRSKPSWLKLYKRERYIRHELIHPIMGENHPSRTRDIASATAPRPDFDPDTIKIIKRHYDPVCKHKKK
ncbi:MAG: hypothetical protein AAGM67_15680, partial [Bacteroidota bacterium]